MDLIPGNPIHAAYRRRSLKLEDSAIDLYSEFNECESEGTSLLGDEEPSRNMIRGSCLEWCTEHKSFKLQSRLQICRDP